MIRSSSSTDRQKQQKGSKRGGEQCYTKKVCTHVAALCACFQHLQAVQAIEALIMRLVGFAGTMDALLCCKQGTDNVMRMLLEIYRHVHRGGSSVAIE